MPKSLTQYRIFIGSPGGLEEERKRFRDLLDKYTRLHGEPKGVTFSLLAGRIRSAALADRKRSSTKT